MPTSSSSQQIPKIEPSLLVSLVVTPWLLTVVVVRATQEILEQVGLASEEIFRGDRLPVLHFPDRQD